MFPFVDVEVSPADGAGFDAQQDVMISHGREGPLDKFHLPGSGNHGHRILFHNRFLAKKVANDKTLCGLQG
jgi:hypothetical protein